MSYEKFKPTIWSKKIQHDLPKHTIFAQDCDYQFKGEVGKGKTVKILGVGRPTIGNYTGAKIGAPEAVADNDQLLAINQAKFFNFAVDDVDEAQAIDGLMSALMEESTRAMSEERDCYIAKLIADSIAEGKEAAGRSSASTALSKQTAKTLIDTGLENLWKNGVKQTDDVTIYLNPKFYMLMVDYITEIKQNNDSILEKGILGYYMGAKVKMSNNFYNDKTDDYCFVKTSKAVAFAGGVEEVEAYRPEELFSDAVKGLNTYGGKVTRPKELWVFKVH